MFSRFFIERPIFAAVLAMLLCLAGLVAMTVLPVQQYPAITPVQVTVQATYPGADAKTLADSVAAPLAPVSGTANRSLAFGIERSGGRSRRGAFFAPSAL
mgnify:CR=1 FL=1